jgi:acylphosphatase
MTSVNPVTAHVLIRGRVQGVGFRAWTGPTAARLGLSGWVRNRRDGSVEAVFAGTSAAVAEMLDAIRGGPPAAAVSQVERLADPRPDEVPSGFEARRTW